MLEKINNSLFAFSEDEALQKGRLLLQEGFLLERESSLFYKIIPFRNEAKKKMAEWLLKV